MWAGEEEASGGKCMVNWKSVCAPNKYGGLGIKDITIFGRALRLRWLWQKWLPADKPSKGAIIPCDNDDLAVFQTCSEVTLGNGHIARFWTDRWLGGEAPCDLAPRLFAIARGKKISVNAEISQRKWMRGLQAMNTEDHVLAFIALWEKLQSVQLTAEEDKIVWVRGTSSVYSVKSAYHFHFLNRIPQPHLEKVWHIKSEGKIQFFLWLLLRNRLWTADRLHARQWDQVLESAGHLLLHCPYAKEIWHIARFGENYAQQAARRNPIKAWWNKLSQVPKNNTTAQKDITLASYVAWNIWKERN